ncbi:hypothetical protein [Dehalobacter sp.]|uniref:DUF5673 domain-containing protein n=2 Tax=Dehalobacter restrictus TaxID=55583 RepID=A0ABN4BWN2_DEHRP|nr:hypothetical protein [Dehalobacter sp.]AHF11400.1 hypothetical protein DEHRE_10030 [Dehalobacter restrictus DSM 9455]MDJ0304916.1 hypothetical protein [Dehalobacter sp.]
MNYSIIAFLILLNIGIIVFFCVRKRMVGNILEKTSSSKNRFLYLMAGLFFVFALGIRQLYFYISLKGNLSNLETELVITFMSTGVFFIIMFFTSKVYFGSKGVFVPTIPFFIPRYQITNYSVSSSTLIIERKEKKTFRLKIEPKDVNKIESAIALLNN